jgi:hypothetical protein
MLQTLATDAFAVLFAQSQISSYVHAVVHATAVWIVTDADDTVHVTLIGIQSVDHDNFLLVADELIF